MNLDSLSFALSQISYSVANLTKKNYKSSVAEISQIVTQHGFEAQRHLYRCLFSHVDFGGESKGSGKDFHQTQYLTQECCSLISKPNVISLLCYSIDNPLHHQKSLRPSPQLFPQLSKTLHLNRVQEVVFGLCLIYSGNTEIQTFASQYVRQRLPELIRSYSDPEGHTEEGGLQDVAIEVLHQLLTHLIHSKLGIGSDQKEIFLRALRIDFPQQRVPVVLAPLLYPDIEDASLDKLTSEIINLTPAIMDSSLPDFLLDIGCSSTTSVEECYKILGTFGSHNLNASSIACVLGMMARIPNPSGEQIPLQTMSNIGWNDTREIITTWNVDVFVQCVMKLAPHVAWREVVSELDQPNFMVSGKLGLRVLIQGLSQGLQGHDFPIELLYRSWKHSEGQLSLISHALKHPDIFCLASFPCHQVALDILKTPPDDDNREIATWKSLDLIETLLHLSDAGHYQPAAELFKFPIQQCADMLVLALLQLPNVDNTLKREILSTLIPIFLGNHPNSSIVLTYSWHCQGQSNTVRTLIMRSMAEWYMRGDPNDQQRLSRILDVAQDLKVYTRI